jgi:hypothetical protein
MTSEDAQITLSALSGCMGKKLTQLNAKTCSSLIIDYSYMKKALSSELSG